MAYISTILKKDIIISSIITIHYFEYMRDFVFYGESHDFWEFLYVDKGCVSVKADNAIFQLNAGDIIFHKPNEFHAIESKGNKAPNLVALSFNSSTESIRFFEQKSFTLTIDERTLISNIISEAASAFQTPLHLPSVEQVIISDTAPFGSQQMILTYLEQFLITLIRNHRTDRKSLIERLTCDPNLELPPKSPQLADIINYMEFHICEQLNINQISEDFSLSRSTLHSLFHKEKQCGAMDYFNQMKVERAKEIIRDKNRNLTEIAYFLSYSSLQHFSKQFKKATGMSPNEYAGSVKGISHRVEVASSRPSSGKDRSK